MDYDEFQFRMLTVGEHLAAAVQELMQIVDHSEATADQVREAQELLDRLP